MNAHPFPPTDPPPAAAWRAPPRRGREGPFPVFNTRERHQRDDRGGTETSGHLFQGVPLAWAKVRGIEDPPSGPPHADASAGRLPNRRKTATLTGRRQPFPHFKRGRMDHDGATARRCPPLPLSLRRQQPFLFSGRGRQRPAQGWPPASRANWPRSGPAIGANTPGLWPAKVCRSASLLRTNYLSGPRLGPPATSCLRRSIACSENWPGNDWAMTITSGAIRPLRIASAASLASASRHTVAQRPSAPPPPETPAARRRPVVKW